MRSARRLRPLAVKGIHCSTMKRAHETALILAEHLSTSPPVRAHALRECLPTMPPELHRDMPEVTDEMIRRGKARADRAFRRYFQLPSRQNCCEILVSHGNMIRYLVGRILGLEPHGWYRLGTSHCGITVVKISDAGRMVLDVYNDTGHLPPGMRTTGTKTKR